MPSISMKLFRVPFCVFIFSLGVALVPVLGATYAVTSLQDDGPGTLRRIIANAESGDTITFEVKGTVVLQSGIGVNKSLTILGPGPNNLTISGGGETGIFRFSDAESSISGLTVAYGYAPSGGAIYNLASLTMSNCTAIYNTAYDGGGGAIGNAGGNLMLVNSLISSNFATGGGGVGSSGTMTIERCTLSDNSAGYYGGAIATQGGRLTIVNSTISRNTAGFNGGGIYSNGEMLTVDSCTITGNRAGSYGGGIMGRVEPVTRVHNSIIAGNSAGVDGPDCMQTIISLGFNLIGRIDGSTGLTNGFKNDRVGTSVSQIEPLLGPFQNNGGPTWTHALLPGSPALDMGQSDGLSNDQRGGVRSVLTTTNSPPGDGSDIGAFEAGGYPYFASITHTNNETAVEFTTDLGPHYRIQRLANLKTGDWLDLPGILSGTGGIVSFLDVAATNDLGCYRVRVVP